MNTPYGGKLINLMADESDAEKIRAESKMLHSITLTKRQLCDLELLTCGAFSPLEGFMTRNTYESVCMDMRLPNGVIWPIPITLDVDDKKADQIKKSGKVALRNEAGVLRGILTVEDIWRPNLEFEAAFVYGCTDTFHPGVEAIINKTKSWYVGGKVKGIQNPASAGVCALQLTPQQTRQYFGDMGWEKIVAFQTRNPMHRAHFELTVRAAQDINANILLHPVTGMTKPGDIDQKIRIRCYQAILPYYPKDTALLSLLPLAMRMAGPREAVWHAIIRKNFGCTHFIIGRDHAGPGKDINGKPFYKALDAQNLAQKYEEELGINIVPFKNLVYCPDMKEFIPEDASKGINTVNISGTELRKYLAEGRELPSWFTFPEVARELQHTL